MVGEDDRQARAALSRLVEPGSLDVWMFVHEWGATAALDALSHGSAPPELLARVDTRASAAEINASVDDDLRRLADIGGRFVVPGDPEWPHNALRCLLILAARKAGAGAPTRECEVAPPLGLWVRGPGNLAEVAERSVAVVGARSCTPYGAHVAGEFAYGLADRGWAVVSGGAYGIDAAAHRGAGAADGLTVAVLACGVDTAYPVAHTSMFERIAGSGLLVSEWPPGTSPRRHRFLVRNRVIAALTNGTVVIEAAARSGALATARRAAALGRPLMAVPGPVTSSMSVGVHDLIRECGARPVCSAAQIVEEVGEIGGDLSQRPRAPESQLDRLDEPSRALLDVLTTTPERISTIAAQARLSPHEAAVVLTGLETHGFAQFAAAGYRLAAPPSEVVRCAPVSLR